MHWRPWFTGKYFILVLVGISHILSSLSSSFHQTVGPRNGWGEGGRVSFCFLAQGYAARVFLQPGPRGQRLSRGAAAARGVARGRGLTTGRGLSAERDPRASLRLAAGSAARGYGQSRMLAGSVRLQPLSSLAPRHLAPAGEGDPAALCQRTPRSVSGHLRGEGEAGVLERPGSQSGRTPASRRIAQPSLFQRLQRWARGESGVRGEGRSDWDTEDGRADLARGLSLSPPAGSRGVCPKRGRAELRRSSETFPGAPGGTCQGAAGFAAGR